MAFDTPTRNRLARFVSDARELIKEEFKQQFQSLYGISAKGEIVADKVEENLANAFLVGLDSDGLLFGFFLREVAVGQREALNVFGGDYDTPDGTGVRDYIHVTDLAEGHLCAVDYLLNGGASLTVNLGTGKGTSVLELVEAYRQASGRPIPYRIVERRPGDVAACWADPSLALERLGWKAHHDLASMCVSSWRWQSMNPGGFEH